MIERLSLLVKFEQQPESRKYPSTVQLDIAGMTLVELMVVVGLVLVVVAAGIAPYLTQQDFLKAQFTRNRIQDEASVAMSYVTRDIFRAKAIVPPGSWPSTQLQLTVGTGPLPTNEETITFNLVGNTITRTVGANPAQVIASNVRAGNGLQFDIVIGVNNYIDVTIVTAGDGQTIVITSSTAMRASSTV